MTLRMSGLLHAFPPHIRQRGDRYFAEGRVSLTHVEPSLVMAVVKGTRPYGVSIEEIAPGEMALSCDCPYAESHGFCKHLYAVILAANGEATGGDFWGGRPGPERRVVIPRVEPPQMPGVRPDPEVRPNARGGGQGPPHPRGPVPAPPPPSPSPPPKPDWDRRLTETRRHLERDVGATSRTRGARTGRAPGPDRLKTPLRYVLDLDHLRATGQVSVEVVPGKGEAYTTEGWIRSRDALDRGVAKALLGAEMLAGDPGFGVRMAPRRYTIPPTLYATALRRICATGRFTLRSGRGDRVEEGALTWEEGGAWEPRFAVEPVPKKGAGAATSTPLPALHTAEGLLRLVGWYARGEERRELEAATLVTAHGLIAFGTRLARLKVQGHWPFLLALRTGGPLEAPARELLAFVGESRLLPGTPPITLPEGAGFDEVRERPRPHLRIRRPVWDRSGSMLEARLTFEYDGFTTGPGSKARGIVDKEGGRIIHRDRKAERAARRHLEALGFRRRSDWKTRYRPRLTLHPRHLDTVVQTLVGEGWRVEAEGRLQRPSTGQSASVRSGIDWFDLEGWVEFGEERASLADALTALGRGERVVTLGDGSQGMLPLEWLAKYAPAAELGQARKDEDGAPVLRFRRGQGALLDALLAGRPEVRVDRTFARMRRELASFDRVRPAAAPRGFRGALRPYQKEGLGWMAFLRRMGFGGCLADDMGLGKTVQVLALLERRRQEGVGPSLVVVPKSLVLNWIQEAGRFAPRLRIRNHTGPDRHAEPLDPATFDLLVTTYGTLRRDAPELSEVAFDYVVLDEAQAIKNPGSASAKAARLLSGDYRLALSGTPIENHLGELWSLFEFLNPGMLGSAGAFRSLRSGERGLPDDNETQAILARALRPFLLRRTKEEVAPDLPERTEQTVLIELTGEQRKLYDGLRKRYQVELLGKVDGKGMSTSRIQILEALLRLRQAALHPGLVDPGHRGTAGAKLPLLVETLEEVVAEGHRALVFSQFTSFLALVRERLDRSQIAYEYLDGRTRDRQARVDRFQNGGPPVFLISLRAGGHGLNLTAADYVFLLDPWWNPAVEAQAIDRSHRIGQTKPVVALRYIARDTVEEKVLELQRTKRELADAVLGEKEGPLSRITREDLELLLG